MAVRGVPVIDYERRRRPERRRRVETVQTVLILLVCVPVGVVVFSGCIFTLIGWAFAGVFNVRAP